MPKLTDNYEKYIDPYTMGFADSLSGQNTLDAIRMYLALIGYGLRPTDNILMILAISFARYLEGNGSITLDEAFRLLPKQGTGSPLKLRIKNEWKASAYFVIWYRLEEAKKTQQKLHLSEAVENLIGEFKIPHPKMPGEYFDADTLKTSYSKAKVKKLFKKQNELSKKHYRHDYMDEQYKKCVLVLSRLAIQ
ncbi:MAG: hypothetical protein WC782_13745 [Methylococcaceae bacterium]|jgi:hypothetical protein